MLITKMSPYSFMLSPDPGLEGSSNHTLKKACYTWLQVGNVHNVQKELGETALGFGPH